MSNTKLYYISQSDFDAKIKGTKLPKQAIQLYEALAKLGTPTQGSKVVGAAVEAGLVTRQDHAVLAAWYFSPKRRPACVTLGIPAIQAPEVEDTTDAANAPAIENVA